MRKPPLRAWIGVMIFMTTFTNYMLRSNMSVSIIDMVDRKAKNFTPPCKRGEVGVVDNTTMFNQTKKIEQERYNWDETQVGNIISAYFYGYIVTCIPGGILSELLGPWHVVLWSSLFATILTGLTPVSAQLGPSGVIVNRFFVGLFGGVAYPAVNVLIAKWAPPKEKGKFMAAMMGNTLGTVVAFTMVGYVTAELGWKWGFYVLVIAMVVYLLVFAIIVADSPEQHRWISEEEQKYIKDAQEGHVSNKKKVAPYRKILTSCPFWMCMVAQFGSLWGLNLILSYAPKFMAETLGFNIKASAALASLPYLARLVCSQLFGIAGDLIRKKELMSLNKMRKFFVIFSHFLPAACMLLIRAAGCSHIGVIVLLMLNQAFNGAVVVSHLVNPQDLSPNFAGSVYGLMNCFAMTTGVFVPSITGALNKYYNRELMASTIIFTIGGCVFSFCGLIFLLFGEAKVQPWNEIKQDDEPARDGKPGKSEGEKSATN